MVGKLLDREIMLITGGLIHLGSCVPAPRPRQYGEGADIPTAGAGHCSARAAGSQSRHRAAYHTCR